MIAFVHTGLHLLLLPALVLLPVSLLLRLPRLGLLLLPAVTAWVIAYGGFFLPHAVNVADEAVRVRLLTYNLHAEENIVQPMIDLIREADADIVTLQELSGSAAQQLDTALADFYPYRALYPVSSRYHGRGVLSRYPITDNRVWPEEFPIPVRLQRVVLDVEGVPLTLYNFHAPPSYPIWGEPFDPVPRREQIMDLLHMAHEDDGAVILAGDFNINDLDENYRRITTLYADSYREAGWGLGFTGPDWSHDQSREGWPSTPLHQRLDYVFHSAALTTVSARVWSHSGGSDHRPLYVELAFD